MNHLYLALYWMSIGSTLLLVISLYGLGDSPDILPRRIAVVFLFLAGFFALWFFSSYASVNLLGRLSDMGLIAESVAYVCVCVAELLLVDLALSRYGRPRTERAVAIAGFLLFSLILIVVRWPAGYPAQLVAILRIAKWTVAIVIIAVAGVLWYVFFGTSRVLGHTMPTRTKRFLGAGFGMLVFTALLDLLFVRSRFAADEILSMSYPISTAGYTTVTATMAVTVLRSIRMRQKPAFRIRRIAGDILSPREAEVAELVVDGLSNRQIADRLFISVTTVKNHLYSIYAKLEVPSRVALIRLFLQG